MVRVTLVLVLAIMVSGCMRWVPARIGEVPIGADVRLRLSEEGVEQLAALTGAVRQDVSGQLLQWDQEVMVSAALETAGTGLGNSLRQRFVVDQDNIVGVDVQELDRTRTGIFVGSVAVAAGFAIVWVVTNLRGTAAPTQPPTTGPSLPFVRIP